MAEAKKESVLVLVENKRKRDDANDEEADKALEKAVKKIVMDAKNMKKSPTDPPPSHSGEDNDMQTPNECIIM